MKTLLFLSFILNCLFNFAQDSLRKPVVTPEMRQEFKKNQHRLDLNHGGIGISLFKPNLSTIATYDKPWIGVDILSDILQFKFGLGTNQLNGTIPYGFTGTEYVNTREFGYQFSVGVNAPIKFLTFGAQKSPAKTFRGHPVLAAEIGAFNMTNEGAYNLKNTSQIWYLGINPGYRIRIPYGSIELNLNSRIGMSIGQNSDYYKGIGFYPSITFRIDALKWKYLPQLVSVNASSVSLSNIQTTETYNGTRYNSDGSSVSYYTTYTTADVHVSNFKMGVQDIGTHVGVGPKVSFMSHKRSPYIPTSRLYGLVLEGRSSSLDLGFCFEGGKVGHGGELKEKNDDEGKYYYKLNRSETNGQGTVNVFNAYMNFGVDITSLALVPFGIAVDKGEATSFFGITAGFLVGGHFAWGQEFNNPTSEADYAFKLIADQGRAKEKFIDPSKAKAGFLGGSYISFQVGAMCFKITNYRYHGAPFASTTMYSIAYRIPRTKK
jgi:hypothetical protein